MWRPTRLVGPIALLALVVVAAGASSASAVAGAGNGECTGVDVTPSTDVDEVVSSAPEGTTFCFAPGTYHVSITPKSGQVFDGGDQTAILDGRDSLRYAFHSGNTTRVTVRGFTVKRYDTPLQEGAIHSFGGTNWTIERNRVTDNAATGVATDSGAKVLHNVLDWNGQQGYAAHGKNVLYEGNEIAFNNHDLTVDPTWEAGGGKAWETEHATFRNNDVHDNGGNGLWDDTNNIYITYDGNTVTNNWGAGIYHEIGYDATIIDNVVRRNGMPSSPGGGQDNGWLWDAGIQLRGSGARTAKSPILISGNTVTNNYNGIALLESPPSGCTNPGEGAYGPCVTQNVLVEDNTVTMNIGASGVVQDGAGKDVFSPKRNIRFAGNDYHVSDVSEHPDDGHAYGWFAWNDDWHGWAEWQAYGHDPDGSFGSSE